MPRDTMSAGLSNDLTCRQSLTLVTDCISATRLATKTFHVDEGDANHAKTIEESVHKYCALKLTFKVDTSLFINRASKTAAHNSNLGNVTILSGATRDLAQRSSVL